MATPPLPQPSPAVAPLRGPIPAPDNSGRPGLASNLRRMLEAVGLVLGPGILTDYFFHTIGFGEVAHRAAFGVAIACAVALYSCSINFAWFVTNKRIFIPWALVTALSLAVALLIHRPTDHWKQWQQQVDDAVNRCQPTDEKCVGEAISTWVHKRPTSVQVSTVSHLSNDLLAGELLLENKVIAKELDAKLSVRSEFVGSGLSQPVGKENYEAARFPEYFVPNWGKKEPRIWTWELPLTGTLNRKLRDVLTKEQPRPNGQGTFSLPEFELNDAARFDASSPIPFLVRFTQLSPTSYHGCLGRASASHVFMAHLGVALNLNLTVDEAERYAGYSPPSEASGDEEMFIWVFEPANDTEAVPATWNNVLSHAQMWIEQPGCKKE